MDAHLSECSYHPCPQARLGCQYTGTRDQVAQHAADCVDLLARELVELRRLAATAGANAMQSRQGLPTPPSSRVPSSAQREVDLVRWSQGVHDAAPRKKQSSSSNSLFDFDTPRGMEVDFSMDSPPKVDPPLRGADVSKTPLNSGNVDLRLDRSPPTARDAVKHSRRDSSEIEEGEATSVSDLYMELITEDIDPNENTLEDVHSPADESPSKSDDIVPSSPTVMDSSPLSKHKESKETKPSSLLPPLGASGRIPFKARRSDKARQSPSKDPVPKSSDKAVKPNTKGRMKKPNKEPKQSSRPAKKEKETRPVDALVGHKPILEYAYEDTENSGGRNIPPTAPPTTGGTDGPLPARRPQPILPHGLGRQFNRGHTQAGAASGGTGPTRNKVHRRAGSLSFPRGEQPYFYAGPYNQSHAMHFTPPRSMHPYPGRPMHPYEMPNPHMMAPSYFHPPALGPYAPSANDGSGFEEEGFEAFEEEYFNGMSWMHMYSHPRVSGREPISSFSQVDTASYLHAYSPTKGHIPLPEGAYQQSKTPPPSSHGASSTTAPRPQSKKSPKPSLPPLQMSENEGHEEDMDETSISVQDRGQETGSVTSKSARIPEADHPQEILVISAPPKVILPKFFPQFHAPNPPMRASIMDDWGVGHTPSLLAVPPEVYAKANPIRSLVSQECVVRPAFPVIKLATRSEGHSHSQKRSRETSDDEEPLAERVRKPGRQRKMSESPKKQKTVTEEGALSPRKPKAKTKGSFTVVEDDKLPNKSTLVDQPPVVFDKRATRSGKEFNATRPVESSEDGTDESEEEVPKKPRPSKRKTRKEINLIEEDSDESEYGAKKRHKGQSASGGSKVAKRIVRKKESIHTDAGNPNNEEESSQVPHAENDELSKSEAEESPEAEASSPEKHDVDVDQEMEKFQSESPSSPDKLTLLPREDIPDVIYKLQTSSPIGLAPVVVAAQPIGDSVVPSHTLRNQALEVDINEVEIGELVDELIDESVADGLLQLEAWTHLGDPEPVDNEMQA